MSGLTFTISANKRLLQRLDESADRAGMSRSAYILQWLPEAYEQDSQDGNTNAAKAVRKGQTARK